VSPAILEDSRLDFIASAVVNFSCKLLCSF
jgi:hypothetical protein